MNDTAGDQPVIGVFLLDDHEIVRRGVRELLEAEPDIKVVGEAATAVSALARIPASRVMRRMRDQARRTDRWPDSPPGSGASWSSSERA
jgi:hypothetical protein